VSVGRWIRRARDSQSLASIGWILVPVPFGLWPPLYLLFANSREMNVTEIIIPALICTLVALAFSMVSRLALREPRSAAIVASVSTMVVLSAGSAVDVVGRDQLLAALGTRATQVLFSPWVKPGLVAGLVVLVGLVCWWLVTRIRTVTIAAYVRAFSVILLFLSVLLTGWTMLAPWSGASNEGFPQPLEVNVRQEGLPDIYHIILDSYMGAAGMKRATGYDNSGFYAWLRSRGFYVADRSMSNYTSTTLSIASTLNFMYLDADTTGPSGSEPATGVTAPAVRSAPNPKMLSDLVMYNRAAATLKRAGYTYIHFSSGYRGTTSAPYADQVIVTSLLDDVGMQLAQASILRWLPESPGFAAFRQRVYGTFDGLEAVVDEPSPKYVFAHLVFPHQPYVVGADGSPIPNSVPSPVEAASYYAGQVQYANLRVKRLVDKILRESTRPVVILIHGDHGWTSEAGDRPSDILNAYYYPQGAPAALYDSISPVNSYRVLFNEVLGTKLPLLPDRSQTEASATAGQ